VRAIRFARWWRAGAAVLLVLSFRPGVAGGACRSVAADGGIALILSGGGAKGAYEVGVAATFVGSGAPLRLVAGSSAGALTAAMIADGRVDRLETLWRTISHEQVYAVRPSVVFAGLLPGWVALATLSRAGSLFDAGPLRALIGTSLDLDRIRASPVRLVVVTADLEARRQRVFYNGTVTVEALLAASAMPGAFPPVEVEGRLLVDGGLTGRAPVLDALAADSSVQRAVVVLSYAAGERGGRPTTVRRAVEAAFEMAMVNQIERDIELARLKYPAVEIDVLTPSAPLALRPLEFDPAGIARAIELGKADALACLATPGQHRSPGPDQDRSRP